MKLRWLMGALFSLVAFGANQSNSTIGAAGGRSAVGTIANDCVIADLLGTSANMDQDEVIRFGFVGQLAEVVSLRVEASPDAFLGENDHRALSAVAKLDDDTFSVIPGDQLSWSTPFSQLTINSAGQATAMVHSNLIASYFGEFGGIRAQNVLVLSDSDPDNYHEYAADGLPDWWQVRYFGAPPNANAGPLADPLATGQNNLFKYAAGLNPTDPASVLRFTIHWDPAGTTARLLISPAFSDREYEVFVTSDLNEKDWRPATHFASATIGTTRTITLGDVSQGSLFFRLRISPRE